ncbi:MAG TPA: tRNA uridine-5-carboxymethylaminomethyl(34) synthesis GTPase MnmE [Ktedonobacterales bacterium]|nr:tRNA uridine-5-carboxymethylaminomethyl(34) synthesis GTPase MnmE [Ktedonobacterales bacterium]
MSTDTTTPDALTRLDRDDASSMETDTIAAIATPPGLGGIGIVRVSGPDAFAVGLAVFRPAAGPASEPPPSHLLTYGHVVDPATGETIDEVLAAFMRAPRTYTRENVVELHAHGAPLVLRRILALCLAHGARAARAGEMTLRAFLNGRLDLAQAEAVMSLVNAESDAGRRLALRQLQGELSAWVEKARAAAMAALVRIEASIDFPEEEVPPPDPAELAGLIAEALGEVRALLAGADRGRILREGLRVVIAGRPNVGKSSLLNALLGTDRAIVTAVAGTTRDAIEERASIGGVVLHLVDTAGLSLTDDLIERIGVERSRAAARSADLLLFVLDGSVPLAAADRHAADELRGLRQPQPASGDGARADGQASPPLVLVLNKTDLPQALCETDVQALWPGAPLVHTSAITSGGTATLEQSIASLALGGGAYTSDPLVSSARHQDALRRASDHLTTAGAALANDVPLDLITIDLRAALEALGEITGETASVDLLDRVFAEFCIGK